MSSVMLFAAIWCVGDPSPAVGPVAPSAAPLPGVMAPAPHAQVVVPTPAVATALAQPAAPAGAGGSGSIISADAVRKIVGNYLKETEEATKLTKPADAHLRGYIDNNGYPWLVTPNNNFTMHTGMWVQYDSVFSRSR